MTSRPVHPEVWHPLVLRPGEGAGPVRWGMSTADLLAVLGPPTRRLPGAGVPDRLVWSIAAHGGADGDDGDDGTGGEDGDDGTDEPSGSANFSESHEPPELVVEVDADGPVSVGVEGHVVDVGGRTYDLRDPHVLDALDPALHDGAHVFPDWGLELWGTEPDESRHLRALAPALATELRDASADAARYRQIRATARTLPTSAQPWDLRPGDGLGPLTFGMTRADVRELLGPAEKEVTIQGMPREVRGRLVCVFDRDGGLAELRVAGARAVLLDGRPLAGRGARPETLTRSTPLANRAWDVHVDLGLALERDAGARGEVVVFAAAREPVWTNLRRPLL